MSLNDASETLHWMQTMERRLSSVAIILETPEGEALIVKASYKPYWSFPGGVIDANETPRQAAIREVKEELSLTIDGDALVFVAVVDRKSDQAQTYQFIFKFKTPLTKEMQSAIMLQQDELSDFAIVSKVQVATNDRDYGKVIWHWVNNVSGYIEQVFDTKG